MSSKVFEMIEKEAQRQRDNIELIASENFVSEDVLKVLGSCLTNKYAEGYPTQRTSGNKGRYYGGCEYVNEIEEYCCDVWRKVFNTDYHVNVQPHSGASANLAAYFSVLKPGDTILAMDLNNGGHLTHGSSVNFSGKLYHMEFYNVTADGRIDYDDVRQKAEQFRPRLILAGASAYSRTLDFAAFAEIAKSVGAYFMVDMSHIAGLVAAGDHPSPFGLADIVTTTTHKTLRGPRGGLILCKDAEFGQQFNKAIFPGIQGGPLMHVIAAKAAAFGEALKPEFKAYAQQIINNAKALAETLQADGFRIVSGGTDNHLMLVDLTNKNITGKIAQSLLDEVGITANKNTIPFEKLSPFVTSGIRLGSPALTTRGFKEEDMVEVANIIALVLDNPEDAKAREEAAKRVAALCAKYPLYE